MDIRQIKSLMKEFEKSAIHKMEIKDNEFSLCLEKENKTIVETSNYIPSVTETVKSVVDEVKEEVLLNNNIVVQAPLVGTFYESPSPDSAPFVKLHDRVKKGDTLFIIEAMKVMNEITAPCDGKIVKINVQNNDMVEYNQTVMEIEE